MAANWLSKIGQVLSSTTTWEFPPSSDLKVIMGANLMRRALVRKDA